MEYKARYWLNKRQYIAELDGALVIVTVDENGEPIRYAIFGDKGKREEVK